MLKDMEYEPSTNPLRMRVERALDLCDAFKYVQSKECLKQFGKDIAKRKLLNKGRVLDAAAFVDFVMEEDTPYIFAMMPTNLLTHFLPGYKELLQNENKKFSSGQWMQPPWAEEPWYTRSPYHFLHSLHMSEGTPGNVAFAQTIERGVADKFVSIKPGKYLTKFFSNVLEENDIRKWAERCAAMSLDIELHFKESNDPHGWVRVYENGPASCMHGMECVKIYAHDKSVLRLAYTTQGNTIVGRAIVREDTNPKQYIRVYPNNDSPQDALYQNKLREMLEKAGYERGDLHGVLLAAIPVNRGGSVYYMPYLDRGTADDTPCVDLIHKDGKEYFKVSSRGTFVANATSGELDIDAGGEECADCGDRYDEDDLTHVEDHGGVCEACLDASYVCAIGRRHEVYVSREEAIVCADDDNYYVESATDYHDISQCEESGRWYFNSNLVSTSRGVIHVELVAALDEPDADGNDYAHTRDAVETHDGRTIHINESVTCDGLTYHINDEEVKQSEAA